MEKSFNHTSKEALGVIKYIVKKQRLSLIGEIKDYFYKSPKGTRLFQLDLGELTLALIGGQDHRMLDELEAAHKGEAGYEYVKDILDAKHIDYKNYLEE